MNDPHTHPSTDDALDTAVRASHARALGQLSPRAQAQLRLRLQATLAGTTPRRSHGWQLAVGLTLSLVVACGLVWRGGVLRPPEHAQQVASNTMAEGGIERTATLSVMDETPDLYVWLASDDADRFASE